MNLHTHHNHCPHTFVECTFFHVGKGVAISLWHSTLNTQQIITSLFHVALSWRELSVLAGSPRQKHPIPPFPPSHNITTTKQQQPATGHAPAATSRPERRPSSTSIQHTISLHLHSRMIPPRLFIAMTVVVSASCRGSYRVLPLLSQQRKPTSSLLGFVPHRHRRQVHLPSRQLFKQLAATSCLDDASDERSNNQRSSSSISSVSGPIYEVKGVPTVKLFTKQGCTLCDKVKGVSSTFCRNRTGCAHSPPVVIFLVTCRHSPLLVGTRICTRSSATFIDTSRYYR